MLAATPRWPPSLRVLSPPLQRIAGLLDVHPALPSAPGVESAHPWFIHFEIAGIIAGVRGSIAIGLGVRGVHFEDEATPVFNYLPFPAERCWHQDSHDFHRCLGVD